MSYDYKTVCMAVLCIFAGWFAPRGWEMLLDIMSSKKAMD